MAVLERLHDKGEFVMSFQDYLKYLTKTFFEYVETPAAERRQRKEARESWGTRWFGVIPMSIRLLKRK